MVIPETEWGCPDVVCTIPGVRVTAVRHHGSVNIFFVLVDVIIVKTRCRQLYGCDSAEWVMHENKRVVMRL